MKLAIKSVAYHRNGICGAPFHAVLFRDPEVGDMLGVVFEDKGNVAVFESAKLTAGNIEFGENSFRGDLYEPHLRKIIAELG